MVDTKPKIHTLRKQESRKLAVAGFLFATFALGILLSSKIENVNKGVAIALREERQGVPGFSNEPRRAVASLDTENSLAGDLVAEKKLAGKLKNFDSRKPASESDGVNCSGPFCVGSVYRVVYQNGNRVRVVAFPDGLADDGVHALPASDVQKMLQKLVSGGAVVDYDQFKPANDQAKFRFKDRQYRGWELRRKGETQPEGYALVSDDGERLRSIVFCTRQESEGPGLAGCLKQLE